MNSQQRTGFIILVSLAVVVVWLANYFGFVATWQRPLREATLGELFVMYGLAVVWWRLVMRPIGQKEGTNS